MTDQSLGRLPAVSGRARDVHVTLTGLSSRQTGKGTRYPYPDFGTDFIEALHRELKAPRRRSLLRWTRVCPACETSLEGIPATQVTAAVEVALSRIPPIRVDVEMPGVICPGCGRSLVSLDDRALESDLSDALIAAFNEAGLAPG